MLKRFAIRSLLTLVTVAAVSSLVWGQAETGQITGTVFDPAGATVPNANIVVTNTATGAERTTTSGSAGDFAVTNLLPANYLVTVTAQGFATFKQQVVLTVGGKAGIDARLELGQTGTVVEVSGAAVAVNTETQTLSTVVSSKQVTELPTLTRNPYALVAISGNASDDNAGGRGVGFAINGQRAESTNILLDGAANNDEFTASVGQAVPLDSVQHSDQQLHGGVWTCGSRCGERGDEIGHQRISRDGV